MLTSKQRAYLRSLALKEEPIVIIGKNGIGENLIQQVQDDLRARELIKCKVLENSMLTAKEAMESLCEICRAEPIQAIGSKFVLYKRNEKEPKIVLPKKDKK
ncbi:MAG: ribosome assembly RNA-binding protein YhbY [Oscillospiraceae bacterium]|nr:ribosome assembly RNA-binding protein YhbY [Oscillospiraceae bacterium]